MAMRTLAALSICSLVLCRISENDTVLPVMQMREVQSGYLSWPDIQLGAEGEDRPTTTACTPRSEAEAERRVVGMLNAEEGESFDHSMPQNRSEMLEDEFVKVTYKPLCDD